MLIEKNISKVVYMCEDCGTRNILVYADEGEDVDYSCKGCNYYVKHADRDIGDEEIVSIETKSIEEIFSI